MDSSRNAWIVDGWRTPFVRAGEGLEQVHPVELGQLVVRETLARVGLEGSDVDEVIFGCVAQPADSANIARVIALRAGIDPAAPAFTIGRNCGSGLDAIAVATERVRSGRADVVVCGGVESMSRIALQYPLEFGWKLSRVQRAKSFGARLSEITRIRLQDLKPRIALVEGLTDPTCGEIMGLTAERLARDFDISRSDQDAYAVRSHERALAARDRLAEEIQPIAIPPKLDPLVTEDLGPREGITTEKLARMKPFFDRAHGSVTIGNSCGITDGGVAVVVASTKFIESRGLRPLARVRGHAHRGCEPQRMGLGPAHATPIALDEAGISFVDLDRIEINEAFAAQVIAVARAFESRAFAEKTGRTSALGPVDWDRLNVNGGAIALGHPVGASGARITLTLCRELVRNGGGLGLATLCIGGGQGGAIVVEGESS